MKSHHWTLEEATLTLRPFGFNATMELMAQVTRLDKIGKAPAAPNTGTPPENANAGTPPGDGNAGTPPGDGNAGTSPGDGNAGTPPGNEKREDKPESDKWTSLSGEKILFEAGVIPALGFAIPNIFSIGWTFDWKIGFITMLITSTTLDFGATATLPDDFVIHIDLKAKDKAHTTGSGGLDIHPIFKVEALTAAIKFGVYQQIDMKFGLTIAKIEDTEIALGLKIPMLSQTYSAGYGKHVFLPASFTRS